MYLWKCWRDARLAVAIFLTPFLFALYGMLRHPGEGGIGVGSHMSMEYLMTRSVSILGVLLLFVAWSLGGDGIGHDIAEDHGAFLLTRPRRRRFFLLADSGFAFGLMALLAWSTMSFVDLALRLQLIRVPNNTAIPAAVIVLVPLSGLVFAALVYAVTYLCTILIPADKTARVVTVAVFIAYSYLHVKAFHAWGGATRYFFPSWWVDPFPDKFSSAAAPHLWPALGGRVIAILVLLLIAQLVLERREIRA